MKDDTQGKDMIDCLLHPEFNDDSYYIFIDHESSVRLGHKLLKERKEKMNVGTIRTGPGSSCN